MWSKRKSSAGGSPAGPLPARRRLWFQSPLIGAIVGALLVFAIAPHCIGWFSVPTGGIGAVTIAKYPKGFDYFVVIALTIASTLGALALSARRIDPTPESRPPTPSKRTATIITTIVVFIVMFVIHDHPYSFMDMFHEGEHLTPASVMLDSGRPYGDIFFLHGFATDGGLDALILGSKPSPKKTRRLESVLDAAALAMLVPIAAEVTASTGGLIAAVILALCAIGASEVPVFPYFRWLPLLIAVWALLRYARSHASAGGTPASPPAGSEASRASAPEAGETEVSSAPVGGETPPGQPPGRRRSAALFIAAVASSLGILWSLDVGICAVAASAIIILIYTRRVTVIALGAIAAPLIILLVTRADLHHFFRDSSVIIPRAIDAIWSLPAKPLPSLTLLIHPIQLWEWLASEAARYYLPPVFFGFLLALAVRKRDMRIAIVTIFSIVLFRTAAGRCSWSHTRFGIPLLGIAVVGFLIEPLCRDWLRRRRSAWRGIALVVFAILGFRYFELALNATLGWKFIAGWPARQHHEGMVPYPMPRGRGIYTYAENASDLAALRDLAQQAGPGPIFDLSGERALYYLLDRRPATRCPDIAMLSTPELSAEALHQLDAHAPVFVVLEGMKVFGSLDGITNRDRIPPIAAWIDANYPVRVKAGRYLVGFRK